MKFGNWTQIVLESHGKFTKLVLNVMKNQLECSLLTLCKRWLKFG